jgi:tetratricopeptide (TPR) repeat protein
MPGPRRAVRVLAAACGLLFPLAAAAAPDQTELNNRGVTAAQAGRFEEGVDWLRQALALDARDPLTRRNLAGVLTDWSARLERDGKTDEAIAALREAVAHDEGQGPAWARLGDLLYLRRGDTAGAVQAWQRAAASAPAEMSRALADRIARAQRDETIEKGFAGAATQATPHFDIKLQSAPPGGTDVFGELLEEHYARLSETLGAGPSRLTVIVYSARDIERLATKRDWAIGFYDGRLRLRADELSQPFLPDLVAHELTHAFLHHHYGHRLPMWVHEGLAQVHERAREPSPEWERLEQAVRSRSGWIPLKWLDRRFSQPSAADDVARAYVQSRLVVEELIARHGLPKFKSFLEALGRGTDVEAAYDAVFAPSRWSRADMGHLD